MSTPLISAVSLPSFCFLISTSGSPKTMNRLPAPVFFNSALQSQYWSAPHKQGQKLHQGLSTCLSELSPENPLGIARIESLNLRGQCDSRSGVVQCLLGESSILLRLENTPLLRTELDSSQFVPREFVEML